jgi:hypothetical protein
MIDFDAALHELGMGCVDITSREDDLAVTTGLDGIGAAGDNNGDGGLGSRWCKLDPAFVFEVGQVGANLETRLVGLEVDGPGLIGDRHPDCADAGD